MSGCGPEMPKYRCHKEVWALKIKAVITVTPPSFSGPTCRGSVAFKSACGHCERCMWEQEHGPWRGGVVLVPEDERYARFVLDGDYETKHKPQAGGYYVVYDGGYKSFSPAQAFEAGYTRLGDV